MRTILILGAILATASQGMPATAAGLRQLHRDDRNHDDRLQPPGAQADVLRVVHFRLQAQPTRCADERKNAGCIERKTLNFWANGEICD